MCLFLVNQSLIVLAFRHLLTQLRIDVSRAMGYSGVHQSTEELLSGSWISHNNAVILSERQSLPHLWKYVKDEDD